MTAESVLAEMGFDAVGGQRGGTRRFSRRAHDFLTYWVMLHADERAEFSWELELGAYLRAKGFAVSAQDELSLLLFPSDERSGPATSEWLSARVADAEEQLASVDLLRAT